MSENLPDSSWPIEFDRVGFSYLLNGHGSDSYQYNLWALFFIAKEHQTFFLDQPQRVMAGSVILFAPGEHSKRVYEGNSLAKNYYVFFTLNDPDFMKNIPLKTRTVYHFPEFQFIQSAYDNIIFEFIEKPTNWKANTVAYITLLLTEIYRRQEHLDSDNSDSSKKQSIESVLRLMSDPREMNLTLDDYARICNMDKYHFAHKFKKQMGISPISYRNHLRVEKAKSLLRSNDMSIGEIALSIGFNSTQSFYKTFLKFTGQSPSAYRDEALLRKKETDT